MTIGLVYYADDPHKRVFRTVHPVPGDPPNVLDDLCWTTDNLDPARTAVLEKIDLLPGQSLDALGWKTGTPWTPADESYPPPLRVDIGYMAPAALVDAIMEMAKVGPGDTLIDLGSGYGPILIAAAKRGARAIGIEQDVDKNKSARLAAEGFAVEIRDDDFNGADLTEATVVVMNVGSATPDFKANPGTRVVIVDGEPASLGESLATQVVGNNIVRLWVI